VAGRPRSSSTSSAGQIGVGQARVASEATPTAFLEQFLTNVYPTSVPQPGAGMGARSKLPISVASRPAFESDAMALQWWTPEESERGASAIPFGGSPALCASYHDLVERAQAILAELQRRQWVDPAVGCDAVMAGLAEGRSAVSLLARDRHQASFLVRFSPGDAELVRELTAIARGPYLAMVWPDPPNVDLSRIVVDFERTAGMRLVLEWRWEQYPDDGYWICDYVVDSGADTGGIGEPWDDDDPEGNLVRLADKLVGESLSEVIWGGWPLCPRHPTRPMWPRDSDGVASWVCEADSAHHVQIGQLGAWVLQPHT
jgi:hypothetical protein